MTIINGTGVYGSVAFGKIAFYQRGESKVRRKSITDPVAEFSRFKAAKEITMLQLKALYEKANAEVGEANAMIFEIHQMMLEDEDYNDSIIKMITTQNINAEYAVSTTADNFAKMFLSMDDAYLKERAADVKDISERLINALTGKTEQSLKFDEPVILVADDLAPSETVQLDKEKIQAFVTLYGSTNSHTAILARMMNIPAIIGVGNQFEDSFDGKEAIVDGFTGAVYIEPDEESYSKMKKKAEND